jgi:membrane protein required for beta-lactamase induction
MEGLMILPSWWLVLTAVYFGLAILVVIITIIVMFRLLVAVGEVKKNVNSLLLKVNDITEKVQGTVTTVHDRSEAVLGAAEQGSTEVKRKMAFVGAGLTGIFAFVRIVRFIIKIFKS